MTQVEDSWKPPHGVGPLLLPGLSQPKGHATSELAVAVLPLGTAGIRAGSSDPTQNPNMSAEVAPSCAQLLKDTPVPQKTEQDLEQVTKVLRGLRCKGAYNEHELKRSGCHDKPVGDVGCKKYNL